MNNKNKSKGFRIHVVKRPPLPAKKVTLFYILAIVAALAVGGVFILCLGVNPFAFFAKVFTGSLQSKMARIALMRIILPLFITSIGVSVAFKMRFWNVGAEGQFIMGAVFACWAAFTFDSLPRPVLLVLMAVAAIIGGGLFGMVCAYFKCRYDTNETLLTLMLNYIALYIVQLLRDGVWRDPAAGGFPKIAQLPENGWVYQLFSVDITWIIAIVLFVVAHIYFTKTKQGYEISVVGDSQNTARYAGMDVNKIIMRTMFISSAICALAGMLQVAGDGTSHTLTTGIASGIGFTAIIVAWLGKLNPTGILSVSILFGILEKGCGVAKSTFMLSPAVADILQGIILFVILGFDFVITYKIVIDKNNKTDKKGAADEHNS